VVAESGGGYLYQEDSELINAMEELRKNPYLRKKLGDKGHAAFEKNWTEDKHFEKYFNLISELQSKKNITPD